MAFCFSYMSLKEKWARDRSMGKGQISSGARKGGFLKNLKLKIFFVEIRKLNKKIDQCQTFFYFPQPPVVFAREEVDYLWSRVKSLRSNSLLTRKNPDV